MRGKTIVITGATSGIGEVAAVRLAQLGARIVFVARNPARAERTLKMLTEVAPNQNHAFHVADLSRLAEMKRVSGAIADSESKIDVLINNAGALFATRRLTEDGLERTFATNHLAYFVIANMLLSRLRAARPARIICTASAAHKQGPLNLGDLQSQGSYSAFGAYGRSKLMNILFTRELARRVAGTGVTVNCLHPGFVATRFGDSSGALMSFVIRAAKLFAASPADGAATIIYLASSAEVEGISGTYFRRCRPITPSLDAQNDADAQQLWDTSVKLSGLEP